ncbi:nucleotide sugar dehydrogenase [Prolixibacteraceae bacterium JC049]|nr:nucleotide sugar dehydrogenase [Prolixibacteraceae bacterium JC049]
MAPVLRIVPKDENTLVTNLITQKENIAVVGLGYVGLPLALEFASILKVKGFDISESKVKAMKEKNDPSNELSEAHFNEKKIEFSSDERILEQARFYVVAVPTPVTSDNVPNLKPLISATETVARHLKRDDYVVFESTVYPGCTEEVCVPILENISGLKLNQDFKVGYSPERINPGDTQNTVTTITKVVSGSDEEAAEQIANVYDLIIEAGVHVAPNIKTAEACKVVENTQRDVNIALMNELSMLFEKMGINTNDVLRATKTKWNALPFFPGLVGGHCIGVDPYYLAYKANELGVESDIILTSRKVNEELPKRIADNVKQALLKNNKNIAKSKVLVRGITFKENVSDIRNSKVANMIHNLKAMGAQVNIEDPFASSEEVEKEYGLSLYQGSSSEKYDAIIIAVAHNQYRFHNADYYKKMSNDKAIVFDLRNIVTEVDTEMDYYTL